MAARKVLNVSETPRILTKIQNISADFLLEFIIRDPREMKAKGNDLL